MEIRICENAVTLGAQAAKRAAEILRETIAQKGEARLVLSTGASQFETLEALVKEDVDWSKVEMFHLDEYVDLPITHPASFRKYLKERFIDKLPALKAYHFVDGTAEGIPALTAELRRAPIDLGLVGVGENGHIAFNDPPADFETKEAYIIVDLNDTCKKQQMGEGWFPTIDDVPKQAVSMTVYQILQINRIISCVPHTVKAQAVADMLAQEPNNIVPATMLKTHPDVTLFLDRDSASKAINIK